MFLAYKRYTSHNWISEDRVSEKGILVPTKKCKDCDLVTDSLDYFILIPTCEEYRMYNALR